MNNDNFEQYLPQLEIVEVEQESDHNKIMKVYKRLNKKIDYLIEKKRKSIPPKE